MDDWLLLAAAASAIGWTCPPTEEQQQAFAEAIRDGKIRYRPAVGQGILKFPSAPPLNFERSAAQVRTRHTGANWQNIWGKMKTVDLMIEVHRGDVLRWGKEIQRPEGSSRTPSKAAMCAFVRSYIAKADNPTMEDLAREAKGNRMSRDLLRIEYKSQMEGAEREVRPGRRKKPAV